jgi:hypothetical protein
MTLTGQHPERFVSNANNFNSSVFFIALPETLPRKGEPLPREAKTIVREGARNHVCHFSADLARILHAEAALHARKPWVTQVLRRQSGRDRPRRRT